MPEPLDVGVSVSFEGQSQVLSAWQQVQGGADKYTNSLRNVRNEMNQFIPGLVRGRDELGRFTSGMEQFGGTASSTFREAGNEVRNLMTSLSGIGSIASAMLSGISMIKAEWEDVLNRQKQAANKQLSVAQARANTIWNFEDDNTVTAKQLPDVVAKLAGEVGSDQATVYQTLGTASSSKGTMTNQDAVDATRTAARLFPSDVNQQTSTAKAILLMRAKNPKLTSDQAAGMLKSGQVASPVDEAAQYAFSVVPAVVQGQDFNNSLQEGMGIAAYFGTNMGDDTGKTTATAMISMEAQLEKVPQLAKYKGTIAKLKALQLPENAKIKNALLGDFSTGPKEKGVDAMTYEAKATIPVKRLLEGEGLAELDTFVSKIPDEAGGGRVLRDFEEAKNKNAGQKNLSRDQRLKAIEELLQTEDTLNGAKSIDRLGMQQIMSAAGVGATQRWTSGWRHNVLTEIQGVAPEEATLRTLKEVSSGAKASGGVNDPVAQRLDKVIQLLETGNGLNEEQVKEARKPEVPIPPVIGRNGK